MDGGARRPWVSRSVSPLGPTQDGLQGSDKSAGRNDGIDPTYPRERDCTAPGWRARTGDCHPVCCAHVPTVVPRSKMIPPLPVIVLLFPRPSELQ